MPQRTTNTVLIRLLACLLLLGTQSWMVGLHAADQPAALFEIGALPSEVEDQHEGPDLDPDLGIAVVAGWSLWSAFVQIAASGSCDPNIDRSGSSLLRVTGPQPSAP